MSAPLGFSIARWWSIVCKEFLQLRRDRVTFAMIVGVPLVQLALFGFAINSDPKHMPTATLVADDSEFTRSFMAAMEHSGYFRFTEALTSEDAGRAALAQGRAQFVLNIPADFTRRLLRGERPAVLIEADATDPMAMASALGALPAIAQSVAQKDLTGPLANLAGSQAAFDVQVHRLYNAEGITQYNIIPGLMGVILTMTLAMMTGIAIVRECERGTMENLLAMPASPAEIMLGKVLPYAGVGAVQVVVILIAAKLLFFVPFVGGLPLLLSAILIFVLGLVLLGYTISTVSRTQMQAMQLTVFFFLPSILLSGFMFPYRGMPGWAQTLGEILPLTHFLRIVRAVMLKGAELPAVASEVGWLLGFVVLFACFALVRFRRTLD